MLSHYGASFIGAINNKYSIMFQLVLWWLWDQSVGYRKETVSISFKSLLEWEEI